MARKERRSGKMGRDEGGGKVWAAFLKYLSLKIYKKVQDFAEQRGYPHRRHQDGVWDQRWKTLSHRRTFHPRFFTIPAKEGVSTGGFAVEF